MNEADWLASNEPNRMLDDLKNRASSRKLRLFACACARRCWNGQERYRRAVEMSERFADGLVSLEELRAAIDASWPVFKVAQPTNAYDVADATRAAFGTAAGRGSTEWVAQAGLLRCLLGNPFRPLGPRYCPAHLAGLALSCYAAFPAASPDYAVLADALEDVGETAAAQHCREGQHARGCHVVDWILGRQ